MILGEDSLDCGKFQFEIVSVRGDLRRVESSVLTYHGVWKYIQAELMFFV